MRVFVIGGTGFIGPHVVQRLVTTGHEVTLFHRGEHEADLPADVRHLHGARADLTARRDELQRLAPEVALDMRPMAASEASVAVAALRGVAHRLVALSSADVYRAYGRLHRTEPGAPDPQPLDEAAPLREAPSPDQRLVPRPPGATGPDDRDKILVERMVMSTPELCGTVLRLPMVYGPGDDQHRLHLHLKRMDDGRAVIPLPVSMARWRWSRGYVENVADAIVLAVGDDRAAGRIYNVAEPEALSMAAWVRAIGTAAGWHGEVRVVPDGTPLYGGTLDGLDLRQDWVLDTTRIRRELGFREAVPRDEALRRTVGWERAHPPPSPRAALFDYAAEDAALAALGLLRD
jgi:nucleoside-diphosphate-sugar epimerase